MKPTSEHLDAVAEKLNMDETAISEVKEDIEPVPEVSAAYKAAEKRLVRKLDMTLVPMLWILYLFNYLDRNNIAQARLNSFEDDLGLKGNQFNIAVSILNVGYMLMQLPRYVKYTLSPPTTTDS